MDLISFELAVWRVLHPLVSIADEFALVVRRDFAVAAKRSRCAFVTCIMASIALSSALSKSSVELIQVET